MRKGRCGQASCRKSRGRSVRRRKAGGVSRRPQRGIRGREACGSSRRRGTRRARRSGRRNRARQRGRCRRGRSEWNDLARRPAVLRRRSRRPRCRELPDERWRLGEGGEPRHDLLHLRPLHPASRLEDAPVVLGREVRAEQPDRREVDRAGGEELEDDGEAAGRARDLDAVVGLVLGEGEGVAAVGEERGVAGAQVDVAGVELGEVRDEQRRVAALSPGERLYPRDQLRVGEASE